MLVVDSEGVRVLVEDGLTEGVKLTVAVDVDVDVADDVEDEVAVAVELGDATHTSPMPFPESLAWSGFATGMQLRAMQNQQSNTQRQYSKRCTE